MNTCLYFPFIFWKCQVVVILFSDQLLPLYTMRMGISPLYTSVDCKYWQTWWLEDGCSWCAILEGFLWFLAVDRHLLFDTSHSLVYCHYAQQEIGTMNLVTKNVRGGWAAANKCVLCTEDARTVSNVAIAQSLVTPNCKSQLKLTQD